MLPRLLSSALMSAAFAAGIVSALHSLTAGENDSGAPNAQDDGEIDFSRQIRPILSDNCFACHGPDEKHREADLRLDTREGAFAKRDDVAAIVPGKHDQSVLYQRISSTDASEIMPPPDSGRKLSAEQIDLIKRWIDSGAPWREHWSFVPPVRPTVPKVEGGKGKAEGGVKQAELPRADQENKFRVPTSDFRLVNPIDAFVAARLKREGLTMSPQADKATLLRRVSFDLTGLPPTLAELDEFLQDNSPNAYEKAVDRLLASHRYGEHQAAYWLDLARYGDTHGLHVDSGRAIWPYRDWVINAFNANMPYDQFIVEQLAGDLLPIATVPQRVATGFCRCNVTTSEGGAIDEEFYVRYNVDRVETFGTVFLGLTLGCAVCHDHKYDPISQRDFYQLFAFFNSTPEEAMDKNAMDPPPVIRFRTPENEQKLAALSHRVEELSRQRSARAEEPDAQRAFQAWVDDIGSHNQLVGDFDAKKGLIAHWTFDEPTGDLVASQQGNLEPGKISGNSPRVSGKLNKALQFRGNNYVTLGNFADFDRGVAFSFGAWILPEKKATGAVVAKLNEYRVIRGYEMQLDNGRVVVNFMHDGPEKSIGVRTKSTVTPKQWQHVFVTYDGSSKAAGVAVYIDGKPAELEVQFDALHDSIRHPTELRIGRRSRKYNLNGATVDEVRFYDRKLDPEEVAALAGNNLIVELLGLPASDRDAEQNRILRDYFMDHIDEKGQQLAKELAITKRKQNEIEKIPMTVSMVMEELPQPRDAFVLERGQYDKRAEKVSRKVPAVLPPLPEGAPVNRLGLAQWLISPDHPLTARVAVNHLWQNVFGSGIVPTSEDFGSQGQPPTHPELLDWLAVEFRESGWDVKRLMKLIVMSETYRQSSHLTQELAQKDPQNTLLSRGPRFRLGAEAIRDNALFTSGLLVEKLGGPSVKPYQPPGIWEAVGYPTGNAYRYVQDTGEKLYRRGLYVFWKRTAPPPTMLLFDAPSRESCIPRRSRTNSPTQALALMNDIQYVEAARHFAARMMKEGGSTPEDRVVFAFRSATSRIPTYDERAVLIRQYEKHLADFQRDQKAAVKLLTVGDSPRDESLDPAEHAAWTMVANLILNLDETISKN